MAIQARRLKQVPSPVIPNEDEKVPGRNAASDISPVSSLVSIPTPSPDVAQQLVEYSLPDDSLLPEQNATAGNSTSSAPMEDTERLPGRNAASDISPVSSPVSNPAVPNEDEKVPGRNAASDISPVSSPIPSPDVAEQLVEYSLPDDSTVPSLPSSSMGRRLLLH